MSNGTSSPDKPAVRLDQRTAGTLPGPPAGKAEVTYWDRDLAALGLRVYASGRRSWLVRYRIGPRQRFATLGTTAELGAAEARKRAQTLLAEARLGRDPKLEIEARKHEAADTVAALVADYLAVAATRQRPRSFVETERFLGRYAAPLHPLPVARVTRAHVARLLAEIARRGPITATRARAALHAMWTWAVRQGRAETNPVAGTEPPAKTPIRDRVLSLDELAAIWRATAEPWPFHRIVRLALLLAARRGEVAGMRGRELAHLADPARAAWTIPAARAKAKKARALPLPAAARRIVLDALADRGGDPDRPLFGDGREGFGGFGAAKKTLDRRIAAVRAADAGFAPEALEPAELARFALPTWRLHDLRRSVASHLAELGVAPHVIAHLLGHADPATPRVTATVYIRAEHRDALRRALELWERTVLRAAGEAEPAVNVIALAGARP